MEGWTAVRNDLPPAVKNAAPLKSFFVMHCPEFSLDGRFARHHARLTEALRQKGVQAGESCAAVPAL